jgi:SagB-type dehydrogenase family enzyme
MSTPDERKINARASDLKLKTSPHIVMYFNHNVLVVENYITKQSFQANPDTSELLSYFTKWRTPSEASVAFSDYSKKSVLDSVQNLLDNGLLIARGSVQDKLKEKFGEEWLWPKASRYYHFSTKLGEPFSTQDEIREYYEKYLKGRKQPSIYKSYPGSVKVKLPKASGPEAPLFQTLRSRRSTRNLSGKPITLRQLSRILQYTWGRISTYETREFGQLLHKTSPSAGARHPIEAYAIVNNVTGMQRGIYHYSVKDHSLELLKLGDFREKCAAFSAGQAWTRNASVLFIMTAMVARTAWKYRVPRVYRAFLLDAGHLSQSFLLISTALGLGPFCIGVISDTTIEKELGLDGITEIALFVVGVGQAAQRDGDSKTETRLARQYLARL